MTAGRAAAGLVLVALIWGASFTIIKETLGAVSPLTLMTVRFALATLIASPALRGLSRRELGAGLVLGALFWGGLAFQTTGLELTTPSRSAFITGLSTPLIPLVAWVAHRAVPRPTVLVAVALGAAGLYFLTDPAGGGPNRGDLLTVACAVLFAGHIVAAGTLSHRGPAMRLLAVQFATTALLASVAAPLLETPRIEWSPAMAAALVFLSVSAVGTFWFQLRAQRILAPATTGLIFMLESVFATLTSWLVTSETLTPGQWAGAALIVAGMALPLLAPAPPRAQATSDSSSARTSGTPASR